MILVTVGAYYRSFDRLVKSMDDLANAIEEQVIIQRGASTYEPLYADHFQFTTFTHMQELTRLARVIVNHAGAGSIILALKLGKPLVVVPRLEKYGEALDDHQRQIAKTLDSQGKVVVVMEPTPETLRDAIDKAILQNSEPIGATQLVHSIKEQLKKWQYISRQAR